MSTATAPLVILIDADPHRSLKTARAGHSAGLEIKKFDTLHEAALKAPGGNIQLVVAAVEDLTMNTVVALARLKAAVGSGELWVSIPETVARKEAKSVLAPLSVDRLVVSADFGAALVDWRCKLKPAAPAAPREDRSVAKLRSALNSLEGRTPADRLGVGDDAEPSEIAAKLSRRMARVERAESTLGHLPEARQMLARVRRLFNDAAETMLNRPAPTPVRLSEPMTFGSTDLRPPTVTGTFSGWESTVRESPEEPVREQSSASADAWGENRSAGRAAHRQNRQEQIKGLMDQATLAAATHDFGEAIEALRAVLAIVGDVPKARHIRGQLSLYQGQQAAGTGHLEKARHHFVQAERYSPRLASVIQTAASEHSITV
ncbi:MAG: hypothetical protein ACI9OJ_001127 [Myxococcota bacterium]|jgi:hypothetical protein